MGPSRVTAWSVLCLATTACASPGPSGSVEGRASCASPYLEVEPSQAQPGDLLRIRGEGQVQGCDDTGQSQQAEPFEDLPVTFQQGASSWELGRVDATVPGGVVLTTITVPADARTGPAEVTIGAAATVVVISGGTGARTRPSPGSWTPPT